MPSTHSIVGALAIGCVSLLQACGGSGSGSGGSGAYESVGSDGLTIELKSGGVVAMNAAGLGSSSGTYTVDGDKIVVTIDNRQHTFLRDGDCIADQQNVFGKLCKGGKAGEAANVSTISMPTTGTYVATNADGTFTLELKPGNTLTLAVTRAGGNTETQTGTFIMEGNQMHATLGQSVPMVLTFVNGAFESMAFGLPMKFVKQ